MCQSGASIRHRSSGAAIRSPMASIRYFHPELPCMVNRQGCISAQVTALLRRGAPSMYMKKTADGTVARGTSRVHQCRVSHVSLSLLGALQTPASAVRPVRVDTLPRWGRPTKRPALAPPTTENTEKHVPHQRAEASSRSRFSSGGFS